MAKNYKPDVEAALVDVDFDANEYQVQFETSKGDITLNLRPEVAPGHCRNLIGLARAGFYDGIVFHRVIPGFVIQGGCPEGTGRGGPGYTVDAEFNEMPHVPGTLSMARTSDPNSAGSQFFLCLERQTSLDNQYTVYGQTADEQSLAVVQKIGAVPTDSNDRPIETVTIQSAKVLVAPK